MVEVRRTPMAQGAACSAVLEIGGELLSPSDFVIIGGWHVDAAADAFDAAGPQFPFDASAREAGIVEIGAASDAERFGFLEVG